jgi:glycosyltransferase involved in cell wall biosynthesis
MIYPSSIKEMELMKADFGDHIPCTVVHNCMDTDAFNINQKAENSLGCEPFLLCVARICPRKNQFVLASVCKDLGEKLILVGDANHKDYLKKCLGFKNTSHMGYIERGSLQTLYQNAKLHILCSFVETPGLSSIEAGAFGCNIISTSEGSTEEYFKDMALYCNPYDEVAIYNAIKKGLEDSRQPKLQKHIIENFNVERCLQPLYDSYFKL